MLKKITEKKSEVICSKVIFRRNSFSQGIGLMFHRRIHDEAHVFIFKKPRKIPLTMWFVFFPIDVLYLDKNKKIIEIKEDFKPFTNYYPEKECAYVIELPNGTIKKKKLGLEDKLDFS